MVSIRLLNRKLISVIFSVIFVTGVAAQNRKIDGVRRLCVVAVHDSSLFTLCPGELRNELKKGSSAKLREAYPSFDFGSYAIVIRPDGRLFLRPQQQYGTIGNGGFSPTVLPPPFFPQMGGILERSHPNWEELATLTSGITPAGWEDIEAQKQIEAELTRQKSLQIVESPEQADYVFLVEGLYFTYWQPDGVRINNASDASVGFGQQRCQVYIGVVVPSEVYRTNPTDAEALLAARLWAGVSTQQFSGPTPNSPVISGEGSGLENLLSSASFQALIALDQK
jgi:hypothetical protein